ncbi:hypothetical protein BCR39DRAFT_515490 [Naematelia encephala]|uniref:Uncharacterized protein n=1 Tax=Naematelia encephala TaxID=71784 RepID=A0A1Y2BJE3_9TREE|nr:hypothetical protein BCR39DRAFT_515490 [Naematelia encephala]
MREPPLQLPILLDSNLGSPSRSSAIPVQPSHIAAWTVPSSTPGAGPSRRVALEGGDNSIWIHTSPMNHLSSSLDVSPALQQSLPTILTTPDPGSSSDTLSPRLPSRPGASRHASYTGRPRAPSSASSILTTTSSASRRRVSAFSPPPSARQQPTATLSSVTATNSHPDGGSHRSSSSERVELRDHLREQRRSETNDDRSSLGLGIAGLGRRGLSGVHGKDELEAGTSTPRSIVSIDSTITVGSRLRGWTRTSVDKDKDDLKERMEEVEVELEMEKEIRVEEKEKGERKVIEEAIIRTPTPREEKGFDLPERRASGDVDWDHVQVKRLVLPDAGKGKVVVMKVLEGAGLCVLRDQGLLDVFDLDTLSLVQHTDLETPEPLPPSKTASSSKDRLRLSPFWQWRGLHLAKTEHTYVIAAHGIPWPCAMPSPNGEVTRLIMLTRALTSNYEIAARLELPGEGDVAVCKNDNSSYILHTTATSFLSYPIIFPPSPSPLPSRSTTPKPNKSGTTSPGLSVFRPSTPSATSGSGKDENGIRNTRSPVSIRDGDGSKETGFAKFLAARRADWHGAQDKDRDSMKSDQSVGIGEGIEVERDGHGGWTRIQVANGGEGVGLSDDAIDLFVCNGTRLQIKGTITLPTAARVNQADALAGWKEVYVRTDDSVLRYRKERNPKSGASMRFSLVATLPGIKAYTLTGHTLLATRQNSVVSFDLKSDPPEEQNVLDITTQSVMMHSEVILPSDLEEAFTIDKNGNVSKRRLTQILQGKTGSSDDAMSSDRLDSAVTCVRLVQGDQRYLLAGDEDGSVRIWNASSFKLEGSWTLFAEPVDVIAMLDLAEAGPLRGCVICVSTLGTVGLISLREMDQLFLIPASRAPLRRVFVGDNDILLAYANGKARVWNVETCEFRRSTGLDAGEEMLSSGQWAEVDLNSISSEGSALTPTSCGSEAHTDGGRMLDLDLRKVGRWVHSSRSNSTHSPLSALRALLSIVLTFGVDEGIDSTCTFKLDIHKPAFNIALGHYENGSLTLDYVNGRSAWKISALSTGLRQLAIVSLLRPFLDSPDLERWAAEVIAFYTASLPEDAIEPDLEFFASYYLDSSHDVHQAARMLFESRLDRMSEKEIESVIHASQAQLPSLQDGELRYSEEAARALTMVGGMALHKFHSMNPSALKAVAESLVSYLSSTACPHLSLAIELCSKGFATWQTFVDPMDLLRRLFQFATHKDSNSPSSANIAAQARLAVLHVASCNPALFMSTLSMDVLDARSAEGRKAIMKLCVFMARKKPEVLENGLPRIAEAVVKSLDPNIGKMRDDVWEAATVILNELVLAFSTIDFHSGTQRLAVGTHEGAVIMYDLKTASRLYVLEPHKAAVSSVNFSPDGRRLVTVSLAEGTVTVWKVGSSLSGFFNVGGPPRQGTKAGEPFKRIAFLRADEGPLPQTSALSDIKVEWPGPRQARVLIKETALTFQT